MLIFGHHILGIFGQQGGTFGPEGAGPGTPTPADQDMEDLYTIRVGIDSGDSQAQMQAFAGNFKNLGSDVSQTSSMIHAGFRRINRYLGLLGVNISGMGLARQLVEADRAVRDLQRGMFDASREASRGGGAMLQWTQMNEDTMQMYMSIVVRARENWRRSEAEIVGMFRNIGRSGIAASANIQVSLEEIEEYLQSTGKTSTDVSRVWAESQIRMQKAVEELGDAVALGFKLEFLGLSAQQIQSLYHSMAVNLRMDMAGIEESLYKVFVTSEDTAFAWQEHIRYVETALARYSKLGVTIEDVSAYMLTMVERVRSAEGAFDRVGVVFDLLMDRMGIRQQLGPEQQMRLFQMISPGQIGDVIGAPGTPSREYFETNLAAGVQQLDPSRRFTTEDIISRRLDPTQYLVVWQSMNEGMMNLMRLYAMQNVMGQLGARGPEVTPIFAANDPLFATFWREFQQGLILDPGALEIEFQAWRDAQTTMGRRVAVAEGQMPEELRGAEAFWDRVETRMTDVYDLLSGWKDDSVRFMKTLMLQLRSSDYREARQEVRIEQELTSRIGQREIAAEIMAGGAQTGIEAIESARMRRFIRERFGGADTAGQLEAARRSTAADMSRVMQEYITQTPAGAVFDPVRFTTRGWGLGQQRFLGLTTPEFWSMFTRLRTLPGGEELRNITIPRAVEEAVTETLRAGERVRPGIVTGPGGVAAAGTLETFEERQRRKETINRLLQEAGITAPVLLGEPPALEDGEPTSMLPFGSRGARRPGGELPMQFNIQLHLTPGEYITFRDVMTRNEMENEMARNISGGSPRIG